MCWLPLTSVASESRCEADGEIAALVELVHQRLTLAEAVARYKWNHRMAIEDLPREQVVIESLGRRAEAEGLPAAYAEAFFRAQIEASKAEQRVLFERWRQAKVAEFSSAPDLIAVIRPQLDALTPQLITALAQWWPHRNHPDCRRVLRQQLESRYHQPSWHDPQALHIALAGLATGDPQN